MKWEKQPLEAVADFRLGKMLDEKKNRGDLSPYLANVNVRWGGFDLDNLREMRFQQHELDKYRLQHGDIVMCEGGEPGRCAIWKDQVPCMMIQKALHRIRPHECLNAEFLYYLLMHKGRAGYLSPLFTGATIKHLPREKLALVEIEVPPLSYQNRVADVLSAYDDLLENNARRIRLLEASARLLYEEWFVRLRFPGHEHTPIHNALPKGWQPKVLCDLCQTVRETVHPNELEPDTPYIGLEHIPRRSITLGTWGRAEDVDSTKHRFRAGDILFGKIRAYFHKVGIALTDGVASSDAIVIRPESDALLPMILMTTSSDHFVRTAAQTAREGSKMPRADWKLMQQFAVPLPPMPILKAFNDFISPILGQLKALTFTNHKLQQARDLLLPRLMNGEVAV